MIRYFLVVVVVVMMMMVGSGRGGGVEVGESGLFNFLGCIQPNQSKYIRQACVNLVTQGRNDFTERFLKSSTFRPEVDGPC